MTPRRQFLLGTLASIGAAATVNIPLAAVLNAPATQDWTAAIESVLVDCMTNIIIYGVGAIEETATFPFLRSVHPSELYMIPPLQGISGQ